MYRHHKKDSLQSKRFSEKKRVKTVFVYAGIVLTFALFVFGVSRLSYISFMQIDMIEIVGADAETASAIRSLALDAVQGSYLGLFSRAQTITYPKSSIRERIIAASPEILKLDIERNGMSSLLISAELKTPKAFVCTGLPDFESDKDTECYVADEFGYVFKRANLRSLKLPRLYVDAGTTTDMVRTVPIETSRFESLVEFYSQIEKANMYVFGLLLAPTHDEIYIANDATKGPESDNIAVVYISEKFPLTETLENLVSFWGHIKKGGSGPILSEIKLQFPPNVYYTEVVGN